MKQKNAMILAIVWLLVMISIVASALTLLASGGKIGGGRWVSKEEYAQIERYAQLDDIRETLMEKYYQEVDEETLITGALRGMMDSLEDPYTYFYTPDEMAVHNESVEGAYKGVGMLVQNNAEGYIEVLRVYEGGPAALAGALAGDLIVAVDGGKVSGESSQSLNEAVSMMKGEDGSIVNVTVLRGGQRVDLEIQRGDVNITNVTSAILDGNIGYINLFQFSGDAVEGFEAALEEMKDAKGIVIDVRNNPGGLLDDVVDIADALLPEGCIVYIEDRAGSREDYYSDAECCELSVVVLVNGMSASASEILAAAVQDHERGAVVGTQTFGKGVVQTIAAFDFDGSGMQYTSACYYTPDGHSIQGKGVTPDVIVEDEGYISYAGIPEVEKDIQLQRAVEVLKAEIGNNN